MQQVLALADFEQCLLGIFPGKPDQYLQALVRCAADTASTQTGQIDILALMEKGANRQPSPFVCQLLEQGREETRYFVQETSKCLADKKWVSLLKPLLRFLICNFSLTREVTVAEFQRTISSLDPCKPPYQLQLIVAKAFSVAPSQLSEITESSMPTDKLIKHLLSTSIARSGAPPPQSLP